MSAHLAAIRRAYPDLIIVDARPLVHDGQYSDILLVNDAWIFRFPRHDDAVEAGLAGLR